MNLEKAKQVVKDIRSGKIKTLTKQYVGSLEEKKQDLPDVQTFATELVQAIRDQGVKVKGMETNEYDVTLTLSVKRG